MMAILNRRLLAVRGIVESAGATECVLRRQDGVLVPCCLPAKTPPVRRGEEISVILHDRPRAGAVLGLVNHTVIDGENYVRLTARHRPDAWDGVLVSALFVGVVSALGVDGLVPLVLLTALYGLLAGLLPLVYRERLARRVDRLIDVEARRVTEARTGTASRRPMSSDGERQ
jgi:hypothetical protein